LTRFIVRRLLMSILVLWAVSTITFTILNRTGDPVTFSLEATGATQSDIAKVKHEFGYDRPFVVQYWSFLEHGVQGNFGDSFQYRTSATQLVLDRLPFTLRLAGVALALTLLISFPLGMLGAYRPGGIVDRFALLVAALGQSVPSFVLGPLLIILFAVSMHWLPASGSTGGKAIILPAVTLAMYPIARITRVLRASMLDVVNSEHVRVARARGVSERMILVRHVTRNALLPVVTLIGLQLTAMLGGAVIVENIFAWPGIGSLARSALLAGDLAIVQVIVILVAALAIGINLLTDLLYTVIDPRISYH
jgi:peptide/nickel transport system permease protein